MAKIFICGDIANLVSNELVSNELFCDQEMQDLIKGAEYSICNFEAPVETTANPALKAGPNIQQRKETIKLLKQQGFDLLLLANNHIYDYGIKGLKKTLYEAQKQSIDTLGANVTINLTYKPLIKNINGIRFGFINACEAQFGQFVSSKSEEGGYAWINHTLIDDAVMKLKKEVDFIIFLAHAGLENYDVPLYEWRDRYKRLCDLGVDCLVASHTHVPQGFEEYNNKYIFYSLGNFYFPYLNTVDKDEYGFSVMLNFDLGQKPNYEIIFHVRQKAMVKKISQIDSPISIKELNNKLSEDVYSSYIRKVYQQAFNHICYRYYLNAFNVVEKQDSIVVKAKKIIKQVFFPHRNQLERELLLLHLIRNETYRYIIQRALEDRVRN